MRYTIRALDASTWAAFAELAERNNLASQSTVPRSQRCQQDDAGAGGPREVKVLGAGVATPVQAELVEPGELVVVPGHLWIRNQAARSNRNCVALGGSLC
jgi:hypothetical protein